MTALEQVLLAYVLNACWQLPLIAAFSLALIQLRRDTSARIQHWLWLLSAGMAALLPMGALLGLFVSTPITDSEPASAQLPVFGLRSMLAVFAGFAAYRCAKLQRAASASRRLRRQATPFVSGEGPSTIALTSLRAEGVEILFSPPGLESAGPLLVGIRPPAVLIPRFLSEPANARLLEAAIAHERAHVRRNDMATFIVSELALAPLAFHPVARWLRRKLGESRELACDEQVTREHPDHIEYARCLLELARKVLRPATPLHGLGIADSRILERRVRALLEMPGKSSTNLSRWHKAAGVAAICFFGVLLSYTARSAYLWVSGIPQPRVSMHILPPPPPPPPARRK
jgi:beta-lactamase regulating signal transducer with metallopeptidase domain